MKTDEAVQLLEEFASDAEKVRTALDVVVPLLRAHGVMGSGGDVLHVPSLRYQEVRRALLQRALQKHQGNKRAAAEELGIGLKTVYNWLHEDEARANRDRD